MFSTHHECKLYKPREKYNILIMNILNIWTFWAVFREKNWFYLNLFVICIYLLNYSYLI